MDPKTSFDTQKKKRLKKLQDDEQLKKLSLSWVEATYAHKYPYNFSWLGIPIIQYPQDIIAMQEIIWKVKPDIIIETGVAHGGSTLFYATLLSLYNPRGKVIGIDVNLRKHNLSTLTAHPQFSNSILIEGSSIDQKTFEKVTAHIQPHNSVLVALDSCHTFDHVAQELALYAPLVTKESYLIVFDTTLERFSENHFKARPETKNNNPHKAVAAFLKTHPEFTPDLELENKLLVTANYNGFLQRL